MPKQGRRGRRIPLSDLDKDIGERVTNRRKDLNLTQQEVALRLGMSYQQYQKLEYGLNRCSSTTLLELTKVLGMSMDEIFGMPSSVALGHREAAAVASLYSKLPTVKTKKAFRDLLRSITEDAAE